MPNPIESRAVLASARSGHPRLGIIGGGQLAKMTALAARELGCDVLVLERSDVSPAAPLANDALVGDWDRPETLLELAAKVDVVSIENEFLDVDALEVMVQRGHLLYPGTATLRRIQDKFIQKQTWPRPDSPRRDLQLWGSQMTCPVLRRTLAGPWF